MSDVELKLTADVAQATKNVGGFRKEFADMVRAVQKPLGQIDVLQKTQESAKKAGAEFFAARGKVNVLNEALSKLRGPADALAASLGGAQRQAASAAAAIDRQKKKIDEQRLAVQKAKAAHDALKASMAEGGATRGDVAGARQGLTEQLALLRQQQQALRDQQRELKESASAVKELDAAYSQASQPVKLLERDLRTAERTLATATGEFDRQKAKVREQRTELRAAGVDTRNLAAEQQRLQLEMAKAETAGRRDLAVSGIRAQAAALAQVTREQRQANIEAAKADLGVNRYRDLGAQLVQVRSQYDLLRRVGGLTSKELAVAQQAYTRRVKETQMAMRQLVAEQQRQRSGAGGLAGVVGGVGAAFIAINTVKTIARTADAYNLMNARLKLATDSQEEFNTAQAELKRIATETQSPVASLVTLYGRISRPLKEAGRSQSDILKLTEAVATSFRVSGATAEEAENGVIQFAQALGAGALRGEEFNSVAEQAPRLMQALAASLGVPIGSLKEMAKQGLLTADVVTTALVSQLDVLRAEAATLPATVGGAMTALTDSINEAVGKADLDPLIDALNQLREQVEDPATAEGIGLLASGLVRIGSFVVGVAADFGFLGQQIGVWAAQMTGSITAIDKLDNEIKAIETTLNGWSVGDILVDLLYSDEELKAKLATLKSERAKLVENQTGMNEEMQFLAEVAAAAAESARERDINARTKYIGDIKKLQNQQVKDAAGAIKKLVAEEKKAQGELKKVRDDRLKIEERYQDALANLGGSGDASFGNAQALKVGARQALQAGDIKGAQTQAQAALKMLQDLAAAGENTYGFRGFIAELEAIELAANDIEKTNAEAKIADIKASIESIKAEAKNLENMPISIKSDEASIEAVRTQIQALAAELGSTEIVIPVRVAHPDGPIVQDLPPVPGYAAGDMVRGPGTGTSDSILARLSNGEFVMRAAAVRHYGPELLRQLNARRLPRFATGGEVSTRSLPAIPQMNPALMQSNNPLEDWGRVELGSGDSSLEVLMRRDSFDQVLRRTATKKGRTTRT